MMMGLEVYCCMMRGGSRESGVGSRGWYSRWLDSEKSGYVGRDRRFIYPLSPATTRSCLLFLFGQARGIPVTGNAPITPPSPRVILPPRCHPPIVVIAIRVHVHHMT
jgi:hypothetical protein